MENWGLLFVSIITVSDVYWQHDTLNTCCANCNQHTTLQTLILVFSFSSKKRYSPLIFCSVENYPVLHFLSLMLKFILHKGNLKQRFHSKLEYSLTHHRACCYQYLLKPMHAQLESHIKTHYSKNIKMFMSFYALHVSITRLTIIRGSMFLDQLPARHINMPCRKGSRMNQWEKPIYSNLPPAGQTNRGATGQRGKPVIQAGTTTKQTNIIQ